ncbi:MAG: hypothetical protein U1F98_02530 [Verrucomicrobiota bacterium]
MHTWPSHFLKRFPSLIAALALISVFPAAAGQYTNFAVAVYCRAYEVREMRDPAWLTNTWNQVQPQLRIDKIYLETHRDGVIPDAATLEQAKQFFASRGIRAAAGIATVANEPNLYQSFCYSTPKDRDTLRKVVELSAAHFDEIILDDFFFSNCKCDQCIRGKGDRSWTEFRLEQMDKVARDLVVKPAKQVNPRVKVILKFPNWYEHYQGLGYNLAAGAKYFDGIYTGTETREPFNNDQHLQQYLGYLVFRYLENVAPGRNNGGWVDTGGMRYADRYAEQLWITLFAKAPEVTLFDLRQVQRPLTPAFRAAWQDQHPSFDFDAVIASTTSAPPARVAGAAEAVFEQVDKFLGKLGNPTGLACYKPLNSVGEDYLHNYLGMAGFALELTPNFPSHAKTVFLAESAAADRDLVKKIKAHIEAGNSVVITSGLLRALQSHGIQSIAEIRSTDRHIPVKQFLRGNGEVIEGDREITIPELDYLTNDTWALVSATAGGIPYPILLRSAYGKGYLYVLAVPDNFGDLYHLPREVLGVLRGVLQRDLPVRLDAPAQVALFAYNNRTFIVESFLPDAGEVGVILPGKVARLRNLVTGETVDGRPQPANRGRVWRNEPQDQTAFSLQLKPHSYAVFAAED